MTDSIAVWPPGFRITDSADEPISGATAEFYDAGTTDARTVYSNAALSVALGPIVYTNSAGAPVAAEGSSTPVAVYVGTGAYKVVLKDSTGTVIETKDNLAGALDTSVFDDATVAIPTFPIVSSGTDYTILIADRGKIVNRDTTGGDVTVTLPSAVTAGDGWAVTVHHIGSANKLILQTVSGQTISLPLAGAPAEAFEIVSYGESVTVSSDGADWHVIGQVIGLKLGAGHHAEVHDNGTMSSGTLTPDPEEGNFQIVTNGGAFTLEPTTLTTNIVLLVTNNASAGAIDTSAFDAVAGDSIATTDTYKYMLSITCVNGTSFLFVKGLQ